METKTDVSVEALLSPDEAAAVLGISRRTLETWVRSNKIPFLKLGRLTKFRPQALRQWIESQERQTALYRNGQGKPFYETATPEEWVKAFTEWAESHKDLPRLPEQAFQREYYYEDHD